MVRFCVNIQKFAIRETKKTMKYSDKALRRYRKTKSEADFSRYKILRNRCNNLLQKSKSKYHRDLIIENELSPKDFWSVVKKIFPTKIKTTATSLMSRDSSAAQVFADYFSQVVNQLRDKCFTFQNFTWKKSNHPKRKTYNRFRFTAVSKIEIEKQLKSLKQNKATGLDNLPPKLLKQCAAYISTPLTYIVNLSLTTSAVPALWKMAKVVPVHKSGSTNIPDNYRPISILPTLSKVLERVVHTQLKDFLESNDLINDDQFGYRQRRSTELASTLLLDNIRKEVDKGNLVGAVFIDLRKAFDTISYSVLINKLPSFGVMNDELEWMIDYLFNRNQKVELNKQESDVFKLLTGVPQGSILGPLLFIMFFDDFQDCIKNCNVIKYADDTVIYFAGKTVEDIEFKLNEDLTLISEYFHLNDLIINLGKGKTEAMMFGTGQKLNKKRSLELIYEGEVINFTKSYKYLGCMIDSTLSLNQFFQNGYKSASNRLKLLSKLRPFLTREACYKVYNTMILPLLTHNSLIMLQITRTQQTCLTSIENRANAIINSGSINHDFLKSQSTIFCIKKNACCVVRKCIDDTLCSNFKDYFELFEHNFNTRNNFKMIRLPKVRLEFGRKSFYYSGAKIYNELQLNIRTAESYSEFKKLLKGHFN